MISEAIIDKAAQNIASSIEKEDSPISKFEAEQPDVLAYLFSENFELLTYAEQQLLLFIVLVIWEAQRIHLKGQPQRISQEKIGVAEEKNWEILENVKTKNFRERLNVFFENTQIEDTLAFIEDMLLEEDADSFQVTKEAREFIFVAAKSFADCL